jgi:AcrR family transcriptional regulator
MTKSRAAAAEVTRAALIASARAQFAAEGYAGADLGRIAAGAGVTTGAVYHHFNDKRALFQAVAEELEGELLLRAGAVAANDPVARLNAAFIALIDACAAPDVQRILFVEAPQVIGPQAWREIELRYALGALQAELGRLGDEGRLGRWPADLTARVLLALLRETSGEVARTNFNPDVAAQARDLASQVLNALFA